MDRSDGAALLAEALAHDHPTGKFHELIRLFERAFARPAKLLVEPLQTFLNPSYGYTEEELARWFEQLRDPATHADARADVVFEKDVRPVIARMEQAAFDVLLNKAQWRDPASDRKDIWNPATGTNDAANSIFLTKGKDAQLSFQLTDQFGAYPLDLAAGLAPLPEGWFAEGIIGGGSGQTPEAAQADDASATGSE